MKIIRPLDVGNTSGFSRASSATYFDQTGVMRTANSNVPRFGFSTDGSKYLGLLEEPATTNNFTYSEQLDNAVWVKNKLTVTATNAVAPDGTNTADTLVEQSSGPCYVSRQVTSSSVVGRYYTTSIFCKRSSGTRNIALVYTDAGAGGTAQVVVYKLDTAEVVVNSGTATGTIEVGASGWYRVSITFLCTVNNASISLQIQTANGTNINSTGDGSSGFNLWGVMNEYNQKPTSYIQTSGSTVTRAADVAAGSVISNVPENDALAFSSSTIYVLGDRVMDAANHKLYESKTGKMSQISISNTNPAIAYWAAHGLSAGTPITFSSTGSLPSPITAGTIYYVIALDLTADAFKFSATLNGSPVNTSGSTQSGTINARANPGFGIAPPNAQFWIDAGSTNPWRMFDSSVSSQTTNMAAVYATVQLKSRLDSISILNFDASNLALRIVDGVGTETYYKKLATSSTQNVRDYYTYFFEPIERFRDIVMMDIPPVSAGKLHLMFTVAATETVKVGSFVAGLAKYLGSTEVGVKVGIQDYSVKQRDAFGNYMVVERAFNKRGNFTLYMDSSSVDGVIDVLTKFRATPAVYVGSEQFSATVIYGFYKNFEIDIGYYDGTSVCTLEVEGLT